LIALPENRTPGPVVIRTYFGDELAWRAFCETIEAQFDDEPHFISDATLASKSPEDLLEELPRDTTHNCIYIADEQTLNNAETPVLAMDIFTEPGRTFRVVPAEMNAVQLNLWISNMDFEEFADSVDSDGVFRGFSV
jgi:Domain of unknown function (DUF6924)